MYAIHNLVLTYKIHVETLRLFPSVPFNVRECVNAMTWKSEDPSQKPYFIPAGTKYVLLPLNQC